MNRRKFYASAAAILPGGAACSRAAQQRRCLTIGPNPFTSNAMQILPLLLTLAMLVSSQSASSQAQPRLETITLQAGMQNIRAEVARTDRQMQTGMMFRREMGTHEGMLFVYDSPAIRCFWMKNTPLPLSIAFIADDGSIVDLADMEPLSERSHCSNKPVRFALEMNQGWFDKRRIGVGFKLKGPPFNP
jgi:uncharacterized membrane protein (UPF0127 family)